MEAEEVAAHDKARWFLSEYIIVVLGVITALAAQQAVEYFSNRNQLRETRDAIAGERAANQKNFAIATEMFRRETKRFQTNLAVLQYLQQHPDAAADTWPGKINWHCENTRFSTAAWQTAEHLGVTTRMPPADVRELETLYYALGIVQAGSADRLRAITAARRYTASGADPSRLTAPQLDNEIELAEALLIAHYRFGAEMRNLNHRYPDFTPAPETDELGAIVHEPPMTEEQRRELTP